MHGYFSFLHRAAGHYGIGSLMGAAALFANWFLREFFGGGLALLAVKPDLDDYYMPMVWGGVWALAFLMPMQAFSWVGRGIVLGIGPGLTYLSLKAGGLDRLVDFISPDRFLRHDTLIVLLIYMFIWGIGTSYVLERDR